VWTLPVVANEKGAAVFESPMNMHDRYTLAIALGNDPIAGLENKAAKFHCGILREYCGRREADFGYVRNYTIFVYYKLMKNITVTLDEKTAAWARVYAARRDMSLSRFLGELLHKTMQESREYENAMQRYLARKPARLKSAASRYPKREDVNDRRNLR
jgi:hypothetical protein